MLTRTKSGQFQIKSKAQAKAALILMQEIAQDVATLRAEHGIDELEQDAVELKKGAEAYLISKGIDELPLSGDQYAKVIRGGYDRHWVLLDSEITEQMPGVKSLRSILQKKFGKSTQGYRDAMRKITKRIPDAEKIEEAVSEGLLTEKEIAPAFVEKEKKPYLRIF